VESNSNQANSTESSTMTSSGFDEFVSANSTALLRAAYLLVGDRGHAEDLVQSALVRVSRHWRVAQEAPRPYAHRVLINLKPESHP